MTPAKLMHVQFESGVKTGGRRAFSLIEVMVAVTLMSVIVLGLLTMFSQTQRAFRSGITQVDVMESGRASLEMMAREMEQAAPTRLPNSVNFYAGWNNGYLLPQTLPGQNGAGQTQWRTNILQNLAFTTRENQNWQGVGYAVAFDNSSVGTLYRYETNASALDSDKVAALFGNTFKARPNRIADGVVHFRVLAYDTFGRLMTPGWFYSSNMIGQLAISDTVPPTPANYSYWFASNAVPAYVELEIGLLEQKTTERARNLPFIVGQPPSDVTQPQMIFLKNQVGHVQVFRQRIPIRNVMPSEYQ